MFCSGLCEEQPADYAFITPVGGCRVVLFYQNWIGPEEKREGPSPAQTRRVLISLLEPLLRFSASPCTSLSLSKVVRGVWTVGDGGVRAPGGEPGGGGDDAQVSVPQFWPAMARLGHLSIQEGPIGALITQAPVARSGVCMERRGASPAQTLRLPPGLCLSVTAPIGKTHNMNYNKHDNYPAVAGKLNSYW